MAQADSAGKKIFFQFTGGEPTLYPNFLELCKFVSDNGHFVKVLTNGSRTMRWWEEIAEANVLNTLYLTIHTEQNPDIDHLIKLIKLFEKKPVFVLAQSTAPVNIFNEAYAAHKKILESTAVCASLKPINTGHKHLSFIDKYTDEQLEILKANGLIKSENYRGTKAEPTNWHGSDLEVTYSDNSTSVMSAHRILTTKQNTYQGWDCSVGMDYLTIIHDKAYRGICRQGGSIWSIYDDNIGFMMEPINCKSERCTCLADLSENKIDPTFKNNV
jgi:organic radical activating enzyme